MNSPLLQDLVPVDELSEILNQLPLLVQCLAPSSFFSPLPPLYSVSIFVSLSLDPEMPIYVYFYLG